MSENGSQAFTNFLAYLGGATDEVMAQSLWDGAVSFVLDLAGVKLSGNEDDMIAVGRGTPYLRLPYGPVEELIAVKPCDGSTAPSVNDLIWQEGGYAVERKYGVWKKGALYRVEWWSALSAVPADLETAAYLLATRWHDGRAASSLKFGDVSAAYADEMPSDVAAICRRYNAR